MSTILTNPTPATLIGPPSPQDHLASLMMAGDLDSLTQAQAILAILKGQAVVATRDELIGQLNLAGSISPDWMASATKIGITGLTITWADNVLRVQVGRATPTATPTPASTTTPGNRAAAGTGTNPGDKATYDATVMDASRRDKDLAEMHRRRDAGVRSYEWHVRSESIRHHRAGTRATWWG